ncbi:hypothetical protein FRZ67_07900 [Panacibacter ginsenosidivorans]|uniref:Uncharacterized protein n=1 Tax=Panacibacter ginsenosidivorans TaxID=1813871 RepID=A0A5B8V8Q6_9BACT|nr:hypothetical protein [Panacibacter ginsenosidivorans]QEC67221.1 hypothetical protein FRZ67_07900 [Panacibacter ginsenosidivorans]
MASGQYYFNDILTTKQTNKQYKLLKDNNVQQVSAKSFEADGTISEGFSLTQQLSEGSTVITTISEHPGSPRTISTSQYNNNKIRKTVDSSDKIKSTTTYSYNNNDLASISTITEDAFMNNSAIEVHQWIYENAAPARMLLIKNNIDTTIVQLIKDSVGNIAEERWMKRGTRVETYYYYYNTKNNLTDIVRYNIRAQRLLPDFIFEYDDKGTITQAIQVPQSSGDYLVWKYIYNPNGLKQKELCFTKEKQPVGRIEYSYK